jgi:tetratricopeptide (TPR) repeat protein
MRPEPPRSQNATELLATTIVTPTEVTSVEELFSSGQTFLRQGQPAVAAQAFDRIVQHDPSGPWTERALFQGALAHEASGDLEAAAQRFEQIGRRFPESERSSQALVRYMRVRLHLEQWELAGQAGATFLERHAHAAPRGLILAHASRALGLLAAERVSEGEYFIAKGMEIVDQLELDRAGSIPRDLAQLYFALGEARRRRAEAVRLSSDVVEFAARLEQRCQLLLAAQSAYSDTMRAYDAHWSTIAGYRVGELYERLHGELMAIPLPRDGTERERQLFEGAMRLRYSVLLDKASSMLDHTLAMAERTGEDSAWVQRTEHSRRALQRAMAEEQQALDRLPFTRADLQKAMDDLAARAAAKAKKPSSPPSGASPAR